MVLYEHNKDSQEQVVSMMCMYTFANVHQVNTTVIRFIFVQKIFVIKIFCMIYVNDCSIRIVQSCIKMFMQEIFVQILFAKIILQRKKANYSNACCV